MKRLVKFVVYGECVPWSAPNVGVDRRGGRCNRFTTGKRKTDVAAGTLSLDDWKSTVAQAARRAMEERGLKAVSCPVYVDFLFLAKCPPGCLPGQLWVVDVSFNENKLVWTKKTRYGTGRTDADMTNLEKSAEDALEGPVVVNDCLVRQKSSVCLYGPFSGLVITVFLLTPHDYPGHTAVPADTKGDGADVIFPAPRRLSGVSLP